MTDDKTQSDEPIVASAGVVEDDQGVIAEGGVAVQGNQALLVARFADMDAASVAYDALRDAEAKRAIDIEGVLVVDADYQGKISVRKLTDHHTRKGTAWGAVAGVALAIIFPPSLIAGAVAGGIVGAAIGKAGNIKTKSELAKELADVITPGTSGIVAVVAHHRDRRRQADDPGRGRGQDRSGRRRDGHGRLGGGRRGLEGGRSRELTSGIALQRIAASAHRAGAASF